MDTENVVAQYQLTEDTYRAEVAAATGPVSRHRATTIPVGDLTSEARLALLEIIDTTSGYRTLANYRCPQINLAPRAEPPTPPEVSAVLVDFLAAQAVRRREAAAIEAERNAEAARREVEWQVEVGAWLTRLEADPSPAISGDGRNWIRNTIAYVGGRAVDGDGHGCPPIHRPRLAALRTRVEAVLAREAAEEVARTRSLDDDARTWAAEHGGALSPQLARAAREGRQVRGEIARLVDAKVSACLGEKHPDVPRVRAVSDEEDRPDVPSREAYGLYDALVSNVPDLIAAAVIPVALVQIHPISRFEIGEEDEPAVRRTGVRVTLRHPWTTATWVLLAEPLHDEAERLRCDECDAVIPANTRSHVGAYHAPSCSLYEEA